MKKTNVVHYAVLNTPRNTYIRGGFFYYQRRVPLDLIREYRKPKIMMSLKTNCLKTAKIASERITLQLNALWFEMRLSVKEVPASHLLLSYVVDEQIMPTLSGALALYHKVKGTGKSKLFFRTSERSIGRLIKFAGDIPIDKYTRSDANGLRDELASDGLAPQSIKRMMSVIKTAINVSINEHALSMPNVFAKIEYGKAMPVHKRLPIPIENIKSVQGLCREMDDDIRWLIALISDTGMRLSEACGLLVEDIKLDADIPYIDLKPYSWRPLKTEGSERKIPLVGASLWAARRLVQEATNAYAFPRYSNTQECKANSASAAVNKWLGNHVPDNCVVHSFRHSLRDRCRAIQCPSDIIDQIGGWKTGGVGQSYGEGYPLGVLHEWMVRINPM